METRASHKNDCKRPALKEKLVTEAGDLLDLAPPTEAVVSADEVEMEEDEEEDEARFPTIGAQDVGLVNQNGDLNGDRQISQSITTPSGRLSPFEIDSHKQDNLPINPDVMRRAREKLENAQKNYDFLSHQSRITPHNITLSELQNEQIDQMQSKIVSKPAMREQHVREPVTFTKTKSTRMLPHAHNDEIEKQRQIKNDQILAQRLAKIYILIILMRYLQYHLSLHRI